MRLHIMSRLVVVSGLLVSAVQSADLEIRIPNDELSQQDGYYRLDYRSVSRSSSVILPYREYS